MTLYFTLDLISMTLNFHFLVLVLVLLLYLITMILVCIISQLQKYFIYIYIKVVLYRKINYNINFLSTSEDLTLVACKKSLHFPWTLEKRDGQ